MTNTSPAETREITTCFFVFDENCSMKRNPIEIERLQEILFAEIRKHFSRFDRLNSVVYPPPSPHNEYLYGLQSFSLPNGDKYELSGTDYKEVKDIALFKFLTSGLIDQNGKYAFFLSSVGIIGNPFPRSPQTADDISTLFPGQYCRYPNCIVFFITFDGNRGRKRGLKSVPVDKMNKLSFVLIPAKGKNKSQEERMVIVGEQIGKSMARFAIPPSVAVGEYVMYLNGKAFDIGDPPWVTFAFPNDN